MHVVAGSVSDSAAKTKKTAAETEKNNFIMYFVKLCILEPRLWMICQIYLRIKYISAKNIFTKQSNIFFVNTSLRSHALFQTFRVEKSGQDYIISHDP